MRQIPEQVIARTLVQGEKLLWSGAPPTGLMVRSTDLTFIPVSLFFCGFSVLWTLMAVGKGAPPFFVLPGAAFVLYGLYLLLGRFFVDAWLRSNTYYGVTDQHVIIASGIFDLRVESLDLDTLDDMTVSERPDGRGTIMFDALPPGGWFSTGGISVLVGPPVPSFERIENVRLVYDTIQRAKQAALSAPEPESVAGVNR